MQLTGNMMHDKSVKQRCVMSTFSKQADSLDSSTASPPRLADDLVDRYQIGACIDQNSTQYDLAPDVAQGESLVLARTHSTRLTQEQ